MRVFGPYKRKKDGRQIVIVVELNGERRTVSYPKWLLEVYLGRRLDPDKETVDHIDGNIDNNDLNNLRIVPRDQHSADDTRRAKNVELTCAWCQDKFERSPRLVRDKAKKNKAGPFCSRKCSGRYSRMLQLKLIDKFNPQEHIETEYFKRKHLESKASFTYDEVDIEFEDLIIFASQNLKNQLMALRGEMAAAAQKIVDAWEQDEDGVDVEYGTGGVCDAIQDAMSSIISKLNVEIMEGGQQGDDHAYLVVYDEDEAFIVDIPPGVYETGGGYSWKKIPNAVIKPEYVVIEKIDRSLIEEEDSY